jgi:hypothetical protein
MTVSFDRTRVQDSADRLRQERLTLSTPALGALERGWSPAQAAMTELLATQPTDIAGVLTRLNAIQKLLDTLPPTPALNRVAAFNSLYYTITDRVASALRGPTVTEPAFLELLDVEFAKRYFHALRLWGEDDDTTPDAWEVLFRRGQDQRVSRLTAAMLGVNAHINFDLALALVATWEQVGPPDPDHVHPDYLVINKIFYQAIPALRRRFSTRWQLDLDKVCGDLDDWSQRVLVLGTRALAWDQAVRIWPLRADSTDFAHAEFVLDRATAYLGEALIIGDGVVYRIGAMLSAIWAALKRVVVGLLSRARAKAGAGPL